MTKFTFDRQNTLGIMKTDIEGKQTFLEIDFKTNWPEADSLDPYIDAVLQALHALPERTGDERRVFVSSPRTDKHQALKQILVALVSRQSIESENPFITDLRNALTRLRYLKGEY